MGTGSAVVCFVQAEDGIRDADVTGVQTCALPIFGVIMLYLSRHLLRGEMRARQILLILVGAEVLKYAAVSPNRSEERRVGKSVDLGGRRNIKNKKQG